MMFIQKEKIVIGDNPIHLEIYSIIMEIHTKHREIHVNIGRSPDVIIEKSLNV